MEIDSITIYSSSEPLPMSDKAKGKQRAVDEVIALPTVNASPTVRFDDDLLEPPIRPTFLDHIEVDIVSSPLPSTWIKISINYPSVQYTVGRVLGHLIPALQQPLLRGTVRGCRGLGSIEGTMTDFHLSLDDPIERKDLMETIRGIKLSPFRQLIAESSPVPPETSTSLPITDLVDLLEALPSDKHETVVAHDTSFASTLPSLAPSEDSNRGSLLSRMAITQEGQEEYFPSPQERRRSIIRIRQKAYGRWVKALRNSEHLNHEERSTKRESIVNEFSTKRRQWANIISRLGGSYNEIWGGVPEVLQPFV
jgi:hypothetical protein